MSLPLAKQTAQDLVTLMRHEYEVNERLWKYEIPSFNTRVDLDGSHLVQLSVSTLARCRPDGTVFILGDDDAQEIYPDVPEVPVLSPITAQRVGLAVLYMVTIQNERKRELDQKKLRDKNTDFGDSSNGLMF